MQTKMSEKFIIKENHDLLVLKLITFTWVKENIKLSTLDCVINVVL